MYIDNKSKIKSLASELLLKFYLINEVGLKNEEINFCYNENGKPSLVNFPDIYFSISHSGSAICIVANNYPVGLDIEFCENANFNIAKRFFSCDDYNKILSNVNPNKAFFEIWTQKEAYIKLLGLNFLQLFKLFEKNNQLDYKCKDFKSYVISVASENTTSELCVKNILLNEVLRAFQ